ncbi:D-methionine transport system substrate-binding protein [Humitalea rosea]|uniref:Lipoprotein n=1 Tax=Humitalea rosea TaxID=990373 RepID=A0A2W7ILV4_9PROT|nr:MetQ/NlpA family ABC transporter substrate-binding protein [Humitalea rosea]PZW47081.1 D-methionine transport system substrate-binding protein [Humitalea rosea]
MLRRSLLTLPALIPTLAMAQGAALGTEARPVKVGVTQGVHAQTFEKVRDLLAAEGFFTRAVEFGDFIQPNAALAAGDLDANAYQHLPFLEAQRAQRGYDFLPVGKTVLTLMGVFSRKYRSIAALPNGARIAIPNDPTNGGRALLLLAQGGAFKLTPGADHRATVVDIVENPKRFRIVELEAASIVRAIDDVDAAAITGNFAVPAGLNPLRDALVREDGQSVYTCLIVVRRADAQTPWAQRIAAAYRTPELKAFVEATFGGAVIAGG